MGGGKEGWMPRAEGAAAALQDEAISRTKGQDFSNGYCFPAAVRDCHDFLRKSRNDAIIKGCLPNGRCLRSHRERLPRLPSEASQ